MRDRSKSDEINELAEEYSQFRKGLVDSINKWAGIDSPDKRHIHLQQMRQELTALSDIVREMEIEVSLGGIGPKKAKFSAQAANHRKEIDTFRKEVWKHRKFALKSWSFNLISRGNWKVQRRIKELSVLF